MNTFKNTFKPQIEIPTEIIKWMRAVGHNNATVANIWNFYQRTGGVSQDQLNLILKEMRD